MHDSMGVYRTFRYMAHINTQRAVMHVRVTNEESSRGPDGHIRKENPLERIFRLGAPGESLRRDIYAMYVPPVPRCMICARRVSSGRLPRVFTPV